MPCLRGRSVLIPAKAAEAGLTIVETAIATAILAIVAAAAIVTLLALNKNATSSRIMTTAHEVVQRNIETAVAVPFSADNVPTILSLTDKAIWDDDGGGDNREVVYSSRDGTSTITGTLYRTVTAEANAAGADIRRVTFHLNYSLFGRQMSYEMTTLRSMDK